jgi:hypothetical protein
VGSEWSGHTFIPTTEANVQPNEATIEDLTPAESAAIDRIRESGAVIGDAVMRDGFWTVTAVRGTVPLSFMSDSRETALEGLASRVARR